MTKSKEFIKEIDDAIKKVIDMNINRGHAQYQGRGNITKDMIKIPSLFPYKNRWDMMNGEKRDVVLDNMDKVVEAAECYGFDCEGGIFDKDLIKKHINKIKNHIADRLKSQIIKSAESSTEEELEQKQDKPDMEGEEGGKLSKTGRKKRIDAGKKRGISEAQKEWLDYVNKVANMKKYKDLPRKDVIKIASLMRKGGIQAF